MTGVLPTQAASSAAEPFLDKLDPTRSSRRKACDLCFTKKIKCDMLKPDCSNCLLYHTKCRTSIARRKANPPKPKPVAASTYDNGNSAALESRLAKIEGQLQRVLGAMATQPKPSYSSSDSEAGTNSGSGGSGAGRVNTPFSLSRRGGQSQSGSGKPSWFSDESISCAANPGSDAAEMRLPPRHEVLAITDHYFANFNSVLPLFSQAAFLRLLNAWDSRPEGRGHASWAAIQIVMALGLRTPRPGAVDSGFEHASLAHRCMMCAQSVVSDLVNRKEDLLGVQVLLGLVMMFQDSSDPTPASVVIGTAVRLAHRLQLQSRDAMCYFSEEETLQRSRVFWIAYTLEKDICLRAKTPSVQLDADIDLPLPPLVPPDGIGVMWTQDGRNHINYLRTRLELAHIEGKVFDLLYSNRAAKVKGTERQQRVSRLQALLDGWYARIPPAFQIDNVAATVGLGDLVQMTKMHHAYLLAEVMTHGVYSHNADWVQRISSVSRIAMRDIATGSDVNNRCQGDQHPPLPAGWIRCVEISRGCMQLFQYCTPTESMLWQCSCSHFSALIIVLSNMLLYPRHSRVSVDQLLADKAIRLLDRMIELVQDEQFAALRDIIGELYDKANTAVDAASRLSELNTCSVFQELDEFDPENNFLATAQALELLPFDSDVAPLDFLDGEGVDGPFGGFETGDESGLMVATDFGQAAEMPSFMM